MKPLEYRHWVRSFRTPLFFAFATLAAACGDDRIDPIGGGRGGDSGAFSCDELRACEKDEDCLAREFCNTLLRACVAKDECTSDPPCPKTCEDPEDVCRDKNGDGFFDCAPMRCTSNEECASLVNCPPFHDPICSAGGCSCGAPCAGGCRDGEGCCVVTDICHPLPAACSSVTCQPGEIVSVTATGAWDLEDCVVDGETCECIKLPPLPLGDVGLHSAIAHDGRTALISAYNLDYGDLMFGVLQSDGLTIHWEFVDGVPTSTHSITGAIDGPRGGNSDLGQDVGWYSDIAVDANGRPHIVYHDVDDGALKYAVNVTGGWRIHTVDRGGATGLYASVALDARGRPRLAYLAARRDAGPLGRESILRVAVSSTTAPGAPADWTIRDVERVDLSLYGCEEECNPGEVCRAADLKCVVADSTGCPNGCASGTECIMGSCQSVDPLPPFRDLPRARGLWPSIQVEPDGGLLLAYHDRIARSLKIARVAGPSPASGAISIDSTDDGGNDDVGHYPSLFVTPGGEVHVAYMNATRRSVVYRSLDDQLVSQVTEEIESGLGMGTAPDGDLIGADPALVVDADGVARIAYQNATRGELRYAKRMGPDSWTVVTLRGNEMPYAGSFGFYTDQTLGPARAAPLVSTYRYFLSQPMGNGIEVVTPP